MTEVKKVNGSKMRGRMRADFRVFLTALWRETLGCDPTKMQLLFADILQKEEARKLIMLGFRGFAKTMIAAAYTIWEEDRNNGTLQVAFWGSNQDNAADTTQLMLNWIRNIPWLQHLAPDGAMDQSALSFDVKGRGIFRGSSVQAYGITGSVTGTRADILVVDDPETSSNGDTVKKRVSIDRALDEAAYVIKDQGKIRVLGTIHFDDSVYLRLMNKGYKVYIFPMEVPSLETQKMCWDYYPEPLRRMMEKLPEKTPLDRFTVSEIELKRQNGLLSFERQCLCNPFRTSMSNKPFNLRKLIVFDADVDKLPIRFYHSQEDQYMDQDAMSFSSASMIDKLYRAYKWDDQMKAYDRRICVVDPAGTGKDELAVTVIGASSGYAVIFTVYGLIGGSKDENLTRIIETARRFKCDFISIESNFGQEMFAQLLRAKFHLEYARFGRGEDNIIPITTHRASSKKERRIIEAIDPVINFGRLIITKDALQTDYESANIHLTEDKMAYRLTYQLSYFSEAGNKLEMDDRIDVVASGLEILAPWLTQHPETEAVTWEDHIIKKAFEEDDDYFKGLYNPSGKKQPLRTRGRFL